MLAIRRTNLSHRTRNAASQRYTRTSQTDEQGEARNEVEWNWRNRNQEQNNVAFILYRAAFNFNVEIDYSSQQIVAIGPMNVACQYCKAFKFKNEADGLCCVSGQVKLTPLVPPAEPLHSLVSGNGPDSKFFKLISSNTIIVFQWRHLAQQKLFKKILCQLSRFRVKYIIIYIHS